jgi:hypothetical protein
VADALAGDVLLFEAALDDVPLELPPQDANKNKHGSVISSAWIFLIIICCPGQNYANKFTIFFQIKLL